MKKIYTLLLCCLFAIGASATCTKTGTLTIGPSGNYATIQAAFTDLVANGVAGPVALEIQAGYTPTGAGEVFPITISAIPCASATNSIVLRPQAPLTISGAPAGPIFAFAAGVQYVTIDGRVGSTGTTKALTISSLTTNGADIRFTDGASYDTLKYCTLMSVNSANNTGTVFFSTSTAATGSNYNTIDNCDFVNGTAPYIQGIYCAGTTGKENTGNIITNCNFADFFNATTGSAGIYLSTTAIGWTINNNRFYQTGTRTYTTGATHRAIYIGTSGNGFTINNNTIGYASPTATGVYSMTGTGVSSTFRGIELAVGTTTPSSVQGNTISGLSISGGVISAIIGVYITSGSVNVGNITPNTIGGTTGTGLITVANTGNTNPAITGINTAAASPAVVNIQNNNIGGLTATATATTGMVIYGIQASSSATVTISGNTIGSTTTPLSINSPVNTTSAVTSLVYGINSSLSTASTITNNTIANLNLGASSTSGFAAGILHSGTGASTITGNTIYNISAAVASSQLSGQTGVTGIAAIGNGSVTIGQNTIYTLTNTNTGTVQSNVAGIGVSFSASPSILRNKIYDLENASTQTTTNLPPTAIGILIANPAGTTTVANNMISLGNGQSTNTEFMGIMNSTTSATTLQVYYNTINIEGTVSSGALPSMGFNRGNNTTTAITTLVDLKNNIINNTRSGGTGEHYAIVNGLLATPVSATGWGTNASNYNILNALASNVGFWGGDQTFASWKTTSAGDGNSYSNVPVTFVNTAAGDLHISMGTTANDIESHGTTLAAVTNDYDNDTRPGPVGSIHGGGVAPDLGADEFDGVALADIPPAIAYTAFGITCTTTDRTLTVNIASQTGIPAAGSGTEPRIYYKKNAGAWYSRPGTLSSGTLTNGTWSFTIASADMGGVSGADRVYYYVTAQDVAATPNITANPGAGFAATSVNSVTAAPTTPNNYLVSYSSGTFNVGVGQTFQTISSAVNSYNTNTCLSGPVTFLLTDTAYTAATEPSFPIIITNNPLASAIAPLTIKPAPGIAAVVTSTVTSTAVFKLLNAQYVTIDGVNTGGASLKLIDGNTTAANSSACAWMASTSGAGPGNKKISLLNMTMQGGANSATKWAMIACVDGGTPANSNGPDNDSITIQGNSVTRCGFPLMAVGTATVSAGGLDGWVVKNNVFGPSTYSATDNLGNGLYLLNMVSPVITGNTVRQIGTTTSTVNCLAIALRTGISGAIVDSNNVDSVLTASTGAGTSSASGIYVGASVINTILSRNQISAVYNVNATGYGARGISVTAATTSLTIVNNFISDVSSYAGTAVAGWPAGIAIDGTTAGGVNVYNNSVNLYGSHTGTGGATGTACLYVSSTATGGNIDIRNNVFVNSYHNAAATSEKNYSIYSGVANTMFTNIDYNDYYAAAGTGVLGNIGGVDRLGLTDIITGFGGNTHSINAPASFASSTDLHIPAGTSTALESAGTSAIGVTTDIDGQLRPGPAGSTHGGGSAPDIGADEFDGVITDVSAPLISYTALGATTCVTGNVTVAGVTITDASGVPTTGSLMPRIYFKKNTGSWYSAAGTLTGGTATNGTWSFTIASSAMGGLTTADVVSYYVAAQDVATVPNLGCYPGAGVVGTDVNTITTPPSVTYTYTVTPTLGGTYNVGAGGAYTTITAALNVYNMACLTGPVTFILTDPTYTVEPSYPLTILANPMASATNTLTIKPATGVAANITGSSSAVAVFKFLNARYVTIDGVNTGGSSLTVQNGNTSSTANTCNFWLASTGAGAGNNNISLKNMTVIGGYNNATTNQGIVACDNSSPGTTITGADNDTITVTGNTFTRMGYVIRAIGTTAVSAGGLDNWVVSNNIMGPTLYSTTDNLAFNAMFLQNMLNLAITGNTIQNVGLTTQSNEIVAIYMPQGINGLNISQNYIGKVMSAAATGGANSNSAIYMGTSVINATISGNKIDSVWNQSTSGYGGRGIVMTTGNTASNITIANNFISDLFGYSSTTNTYWPVGIDVEGTTGGVSIYNNSVNLASSYAGYASVATGSACLLINTTTASAVDVRNNVFVNSCDNTASTTDKGWAIYSAVANTAFSNIDYNDYYVSGPNVLANIGGTDRTSLSNIVTGFGGNANSANAQPFFVSNKDLHLQLVSANSMLVPGTVLAAVTKDIDSTTRSATMPVMGAHEANLAPLGPAIVYTPLGSTCATTDRTIITTIRNVYTGVPMSGTLVPRIYYKKNAGTWMSYPGTFVSGTTTSATWNFTILASDLGTTVATDSIFYYIIAQDNAGHVASMPSAGLVATNVNTVSSAPSPANNYQVLNLNGIYNVGVGQQFPTITSAVNAYNAGCLSGPVTFVLTDATYPSEPSYPLTILANASASATNTLTIRPAAGVATSITGSATAVAVFKLLNAKYVTLDGVNAGGSSMTVTNTNATTSGNTCDIWLAAGSTAGSGNNNITLKNMAIIGGYSSSATNNGIVAVIDGASPANTAGMDNDNVTIAGNSFIRMGYTIRAIGTATVSAGGLDNWTITNNIMGPSAYSATDNIGLNGLLLNDMLNVVLSNNTMQNVGYTTATTTVAGFYLQQNVNGILISNNTLANLTSAGTGTGAASNMGIYLGSGVINATVTGNKIQTLSNVNTAGYGARAIIANTGNAASNIVIANNFISDVYGYSNTTNTLWPVGIDVDGATGGVSIYDNTVNLFGYHLGLTTATGSACLFVNTTGTSIDVRNNIFVNTYDNITSSTDKGWAIYSVAANTVYSNINYNDYYAAAPNVLAYIGSDRLTLANIVTGFGGNANSISSQPLFMTQTDLHIQPLGVNLPLIAGTSLAAVTTDIDGATRGTPPVIGADEVSIPTCSGAPTHGVVASSALSGCLTFNPNLILTGSTTGTGVTLQWQSSTDSSSWTSITGATSFTYSPTVSTPTYYRTTITCSTSGLSDSTPGLKLISNSLPVITGLGATCVGSSITLSATPAGGTWVSGATATATVTPTTGVVTGVALNVAPITYTAPTGCAAVSAVDIVSAPTLPILTTGTAAICQGGSLPLTATSVYSGLIGTVNSGTISVVVPDNLPTGTATTLAVGLPAGAVITGASVKLNVSMASSISDLAINLTAPNGNTLNLFNRNGAAGANLVNTVISSTGTTTLASGVAPFTNTYAAAAGTGSIGTTAYPVTTTTWSSLYSVPDGIWTLSLRDFAAPNIGMLTSWTLTLNYTIPANITWSPASTLFTDAGLTVPYTGTATTSVYAAPTAPGTVATVTTYSATASVSGCAVSGAATSVVTANPLPANIVGANAVCVGSTTTLTNAITGGSWSSSLPANASVGSATGIVAGLAAGSVTMTYTTPGTGCYKTMLMTVNPLPTALPGSAVCEGAITTLTDVDAGGTWSVDAASVATVGSATGALTGVSAGFAQITYTLPTSCRIMQQVTVNPVANVSVSPDPVPGICFGSTTTLTASSVMNNFALLSQDFNSGLGAWTITNIAGSSDSYWQLTASPGYGDVAGDGSQMIEAAPSAYSGITNTLFTSPSFSTVGYDTVTLSFNEYLLSSVSSDVKVAVEYSIDGGTSWDTVLDQVNNIVGDGTWSSAAPEVAVGLPAGALNQPNVKLRWNYFSNLGFWWAVDNIKVTAAQPAPSYTWSGVSGATGLSCTACTSVSVTPPSTGASVYRIVTATTAGCADSTTATVTVNPLPSAIAGTLVVCEGSTVTATDADASGTWSTAATSIATIDAPSGAITGVAAGTAEITYTLPTGCTTTTIVTVNPTPGAIDGTPQVCQGLTTSLSDTSMGGTWSSSDASIANIDASGLVYGASAGTATISYAFATGCMATVGVIVNPLPAAIGGTLVVCEGSTATITDASSGGTWITSSSAIADVGSASGLVTGNLAGTTDVTYTLPTGCITTATVTVNHTPVAIGGTLQVCQGLTTTLNNTDLGGTWSTSDASIANIDASGVVTGGVAGTATISYAFTTGCMTTVVVTVNPLPSAIGGTPVVCEGSTVTLTDATSDGTWSTSSSSIADIGSATGVVTGNLAGTTDVTYTLPTGCLITATVTVNHTPVSIGGTPQVCEGLTTTLNNTDLGGIWSSNSSAIADIGSANGVALGNSAGTTDVTYTLPTGCLTTATVTVNHTPVAIDGAMQVCEGATTDLSDTDLGGTWSSSITGVATIDGSGIVSGLVAGNTIITYALPTGCIAASVVTVNVQPAAITGTVSLCQGVSATLTDAIAGGSWSSSTTTVATVDAASGLFTGVSAGFATITYTMASGCNVTADVTVTGAPAAIVGTTEMCSGSATTLTDSSPAGSWTSSSTGIASVSAAGIVSGINMGTATITYALSASCISTAVVTVDPLPAPITGAASVCLGATTTFTDGTLGGTWASSTPAVAAIDMTTGVATAMAAGTTLLTYTSPMGCIRTRIVTVNALPAAITGPSETCLTSAITMADATSGGSWSSGAATVAVIGSTGALSTLSAGVAPITYTLPTGCIAVTSVTVNPTPGTISGTTTVCAGFTTTLTNGVSGGTWTSGTPANALVDAATGVVTAVGVGSSVISYTLPAGCSKSVVVVVNAAPSAITGATDVCQGATITMTASGGGMWASSNTAIANVNPITGAVTGLVPGTTNISYTIPSGGCYAVHTITVDVAPAAFTGAFTVCSGQATTLGSATTGGIWSSSNAAVATVGTSGDVSGVSAGTSVITYAASTGCTRSAVVTVNALPAAYNVTGGGTYCIGGSGVHIGLDGSNTSTSYRLYFGSVPFGSPLTGTGSPLDFGIITGIGAYTVLATNTTSGCASAMTGGAAVLSASVVIPSVSISTGTGDTMCLGVLTTFNASSVNGGTGPTYQWQVNGTNVGLGGSTYSYMPVNGDIVSVQMNSSLACAIPTMAAAVMPVTVLVSQMPVAALNVTPNDTVCLGTAVTFSVTPAYGGSAPTYTWKNGAGTTLATGVMSYAYTPADGDMIYVQMSSNYRCRLADNVESIHTTMVIDSPIAPVVIVTGPATFSVGQPATFTASVTNGGVNPIFQWYVNNVSITGATSNVFTSSSLANNDSVKCVVIKISACAPMSGYGSVRAATRVSGLTFANSDIRLLPNPNTGDFVIKGTVGSSDDQDLVVEITDMLGQVIYKDNVPVHNNNINQHIRLSNKFASGMYMLTLRSATESKVFHLVLEPWE